MASGEMVYIVTADEAANAGTTPEQFAAELRPVLAGFGVAVEVRPDLKGPGQLIGAPTNAMEVDVRQAIARVRIGGPAHIVEVNQDPSLAPRTEEN